MTDKKLYNKTIDFNDDAYRNIVSLRESVNLFDDLTDGDDELSQVAIEAEMRVKQNIKTGIIHRGFHYNTAISYPFESEPYMHTRYGDGTYGVWYGSVDLKTTVYATAFHMIRAELNIEGLRETIVRERAVYKVHCHAILIDLSLKNKQFPELNSNDYGFTHSVGRRIHKEGQPGLVYKSARCEGDNIAIFNAMVLSNSRHHCYLTYYFNPNKLEVKVERQVGKTWLIIEGKKLGLS